jgi:hypothetical protein
MKPYLLNSFKNKMLLVLLFAGILATTLNSCTVSSELSYQTYTPPAWAPPYDDVSSIQYYYFPDYDMYYDVWGSQFWYNSNGVWVPSATLPPAYADVNLYNSYVVLVNKKYATPWVRHDYFVKNYPPHVYDNYQNIVVTNRIVKNVEPNHDLVPRAYNENTNRVTFMQRQRDANTSQQNQQLVQGSERQPIDRDPNQHQPTPAITPQITQPVQGSERQPFNRQPNQQQPVQDVTPQPLQGSERQPFSRQPNQQQTVQNTSVTPTYHRVSQEVPMKSIRPYLQQQPKPQIPKQPN